MSLTQRPFDQIAQSSLNQLVSDSVMHTSAKGSDAKGYMDMGELPYKAGHKGYSTGYGGWKFSKAEMSARAVRLARQLPHILQSVDADAIVVLGTSGTFMAAAVTMLEQFPFVMLRKLSDLDSHGHPIEGRDLQFRRYIILDDCIGSGRTVNGMIERLPEARCVGLVLHESSYCRDLTRGTANNYDRSWNFPLWS